MNKENKKMTQIARLFKYCTFWNESKRKIIIEYIAIVIICIFAIVSYVTMITIEQLKNPDEIIMYVLAILGFVIPFSLLPILLLIFIIKNENKRKEVILWLEDAVEVEAYAKKIDVKYWIGLPLIKLQVEFGLNGIHYIRSTENEHRGKLDIGRPVGYFAHITKYADRKINILYSPKYDQVMILKD